MQARDVMTTTMVTVSPDTTVSEVARTLLAHDIGAVPVVDERGAVVGVVSETDLLRRPKREHCGSEAGSPILRLPPSWRRTMHGSMAPGHEMS